VSPSERLSYTQRFDRTEPKYGLNYSSDTRNHFTSQSHNKNMSSASRPPNLCYGSSPDYGAARLQETPDYYYKRDHLTTMNQTDQSPQLGATL
jgi:hypothetical protein